MKELIGKTEKAQPHLPGITAQPHLPGKPRKHSLIYQENF